MNRFLQGVFAAYCNLRCIIESPTGSGFPADEKATSAVPGWTLMESCNVSCLKHIYPDTTEIHICGLDFVVNRGERSRSSAETVGQDDAAFIILGLLTPDEGQVTVFGVNPANSTVRFGRDRCASPECGGADLLADSLGRYLVYSPQLRLEQDGNSTRWSSR